MTSQSPSFIFVGNDLALDFINTLILRGSETHDLWQKTEDLSAWITQAGFNLSEPVVNTELKKAKKLRSALKSLFSSVMTKQKPCEEHLNLLNAILSVGKSSPTVEIGKTGLLLKESNRKPKFIDFLSDVALAAALQLTAEDLNRLRTCSNEQCVISFKDISKSGRRKWCSMETCGNRTKVAKHYLNSR